MGHLIARFGPRIKREVGEVRHGERARERSERCEGELPGGGRTAPPPGILWS